MTILAPFAASFDGPWDSYLVDFASKPLELFDSIFVHVVDMRVSPDPEQPLKEFILSAQTTAGGYARNYPGHGGRRSARPSGSTTPSRRCWTTPTPRTHCSIRP